MKIAICDDTKSHRLALVGALNRFKEENFFDFSIEAFSSPVELMEGQPNIKAFDYHVIFMDIYMPEHLGTDVTKFLRGNGYDGHIIFCTTSEDHALEGYRLRADGYLVKPFTYEEFCNSIWNIHHLFKKAAVTVNFVSDRVNYSLPAASVEYIETEKKGCRIYTKEKSYFTQKKISEFTSELAELSFFCQVNRSYLVNMDYVTSVSSDEIIMLNGISIVLPARTKVKLRQFISDYLSEK